MNNRCLNRAERFDIAEPFAARCRRRQHCHSRRGARGVAPSDSTPTPLTNQLLSVVVKSPEKRWPNHGPETHGVTVRVAVKVPPLVAEMVTVVEVVTVFVVTVKVALVLPAATVTLAGTVAAAVRLLERVTTVPLDGAGPESVTVPVDGESPLTVVGLRVRELTMGAVTVKVAVRVVLRVPEIFAEVLAATGLVVTVNVAVVAFAATVTLVGTWAAAVLLLNKVTTAPPVGAGPFNVTVPVEGVPPIDEVGFRVTVLRVAAVTVKVPVFVAP